MIPIITDALNVFYESGFMSYVRVIDKKESIHWNLFQEHEVINLQRGSFIPPFRIASPSKINPKKCRRLIFQDFNIRCILLSIINNENGIEFGGTENIL